jgi:phosphoglycolate phosphatase-like HAD superfamily hydrolase
VTAGVTAGRIAAIVDIDGTLVDSNYQHALAWYRAFRGVGVQLELRHIHRHIGMGGDQLVEALAGEAVEREHGDALREAEGEEFSAMRDEVGLVHDATELLRTLAERCRAVYLSSSGRPQEVEHWVDALDARDLASGWSSSGDVERTKPAPDLVGVALDAVGGEPAVMIGDTPWDCIAATRAGIPTIALLTGGFSRKELEEAGAAAVYESLADLMEHLDDALLAEARA